MKLIDKDAVVAEINSIIDVLEKNSGYLGGIRNIQKAICDKILSFIDTIEIKEVDLEKEYKDFVEEDPVYNKLVNSIVGKAIAKHFFELGLKAQKGK